MKVLTAGVYVLYSHGEVVYVGESNNLYERIGQHIAEGVKEFDSFDLYETDDRKRLESFLIEAFHPKYNAVSGCYAGDFRIGEPRFTSPEIEDAIKAYEKNTKTISIGQIAEELDVYERWIFEAFRRHKSKIPAWNLNGYWEVDYQWYKNNSKTLERWAMDGD